MCFTEHVGDLFQEGDNVSLAHCVSADMEMDTGISVEFKRRFGRVEQLLNHSKREREEMNFSFFYY